MRTRVIDVCVVCCAALSFALTGCDAIPGMGGGGGQSGGEESSDESEGEGGDDEKKKGDAPIEQETYVKAAFEIQCVDRELGDELDLERIREDIFSNYDIESETYEEAEEYFTASEDDDETEAQEEIKSRLEEDCTKAKARSLAGQAPIDKETYVDATFELSCIEEELGDDVEMEKMEERVYKRKDIDEDTYSMAEEFFSDKDEVEETIKSRMEEKCTKSRAQSFAGINTGPAFTGTLNGSASGQANFGTAKLKITIKGNYSAFGNFQGTRDGKGFRIPLEGRVSKNNRLNLQGSSGQNNIDVTGRVSGGGMNASVNGSIFGESLSLSIRMN